MIATLALSLVLSAADPTLAGGLGSVPPPPTGTVIVDDPCRIVVAQSRSHARACSGSTISTAQYTGYGQLASSRVVTSGSSTTYGAAHHAGAPTSEGSGRRVVTLSDSFFSSGLTGGVERPHAPHGIYGRGVIVIGTSHAPQSAGQAAAARGLARPSH